VPEMGVTLVVPHESLSREGPRPDGRAVPESDDDPRRGWGADAGNLTPNSEPVDRRQRHDLRRPRVPHLELSVSDENTRPRAAKPELEADERRGPADGHRDEGNGGMVADQSKPQRPGTECCTEGAIEASEDGEAPIAPAAPDPHVFGDGHQRRNRREAPLTE